MSADDHVVQRLQQQLADARKMGFRVRLEMLDGEQATWCEVAGVRTLFVDLSQTAAEQLQQVRETLSAYQNALIASSIDPSRRPAPPHGAPNQEKRAA